MIEKHMEHLQMKTLLSICVLLTSISTVIGFFLSKYKAKILKSSEQDKTNVKEEAKSWIIIFKKTQLYVSINGHH